MSPAAPIKILLIDSNAPIRMLLRRWIDKTTSAEIVEAQDGIEALEKLASEKPDLVVMDLELPMLNGLDLLRIIQPDARSGLEILIAAGVSAEGQVREAISLGVSDYILKPLQDEWVMRRVSAAVARVQQRREQFSDKERETPRVLFAAPDPNFREFAVSALTGRFAVEGVKSAAELLVKALRWTPDLVVVSDAFPPSDLTFLTSRLRHLPSPRERNILLLTADPGEADAEGFDGTVTRTFVPHQLLAEINAAYKLRRVGVDGLESLALLLAAQVSTAIKQTLGMMTGVEPSISPEHQELPASIHGAISLIAEDESFQIRTMISCDHAFSSSVGAAMLGLPAEECEDDSVGLDVVRELLNVVGGRSKHSCDEQGLPTKLGLPKIFDSKPEPLANLAGGKGLTVLWGDQTFAVDFQVAMGCEAGSEDGG